MLVPIDFLARGTRHFAERIGVVVPDIDYRRVRLDPVLGGRISGAYMAAPRWDPCALDAYRAIRRETREQFAFLTGDTDRGGLGVAVEVVDDDPYPDALPMMDDLRHHRLQVFSTKASRNPHPFLTDADNDMFRAVHDAFGHAASGRGFDADGEEAAWLCHRPLYSRLARWALATETRGQTCCQLFHYKGKRFPEQKLALLPANLANKRQLRHPARAPAQVE